MSEDSKPAPRPVNRRASQRLSLRGVVKIECRKGSLGLGPNLAVTPLNLSETGARAVLKTDLPKGQEVEIIVQGAGQPVKRLARVMWSRTLPEGMHEVAFRFDANLSYAECQRFTQIQRSLG